MNQEMMRFYRENKVNPLASCLPMVAQFPVFISLYYMLRIDLRHDICPEINGPARRLRAPDPVRIDGESSFLFIPDLTDKATGGDADHPDRALRRLAAGLDAADVDDDGPDAADDLPGAAVRLRHVRDPVPGRPARVLDHHEPVDDRAAADHQEAPRAAAARRSRRARRRRLVRRLVGPAAAAARRGRREPPATGPKTPARAKEPASVGGGSEPKGRPSAPPPAPPRKKKKRSGRRR